jgi:hypothetical protein
MAQFLPIAVALSVELLSYLTEVIEIWILEYPVQAISDRTLDIF